ncbi:MAG TPA: aspartate--tRNA(Asn) ligase [bacterium]|jgi:nondiscriminating aspartyl-tRNA synthetase|nr:aspartate--tRNA(Asn) ligase [bacterium]
MALGGMQRRLSAQPRTLAAAVRPEQPEVHLAGSVHTVRTLGGVAFLILRDRSGMIQVVAPGDLDVPREAVVEITGTARSEGRAPGGVEVAATEITVISRPAGRLPFDVSKPVLHAELDTALDHRALSLRHPRTGAIFRVASALTGGFRRALADEGFMEIHTSKLVGSATEGGAGLFRVDYPDRAAYLAQSPQLYKQICVGAFERVFEIGPVFRNEPHATTRHLNEYTSLDVEAAYLDLDGLLDLETRVLAAMLEEVARSAALALDQLGVRPPAIGRIPRLRLDEAKARLASRGKTYAPEEDLNPAGERLLGEMLGEEGQEFVFVSHYPAAARPFYAAPDPDDRSLTLSFDLLFRGVEVTTGGMRIHDLAQLRENMERFGLDPTAFAGYLEAFACAMPPHGGFAIGLERLTAQLVGAPNLRWAALFPRDRRRLEP